MPHIELDLAGLPLNRPVRIELGSNGIVVVRRQDGVSAFEDSCPHAQWRLSLGQIADGLLECAGHGWEFDVTTGRCLTVPAYCLKRCAVSVLDGRVRVELVEARAENVRDQITA
jgi:nitrite reductase/ring-hydroxylating ferredoxin subunit